MMHQQGKISVTGWLLECTELGLVPRSKQCGHISRTDFAWDMGTHNRECFGVDDHVRNRLHTPA